MKLAFQTIALLPVLFSLVFFLVFGGFLKVIEYLTNPLVAWSNKRQLEKDLGRKL